MSSRQVRRQNERLKAKGHAPADDFQPLPPFAPWVWSRSTPRRAPGEQTKTVTFQPWGYVSKPRKTSPARARRRLEAKRRYVLGQIRDHEVGINPVYLGRPRDGAAHKAWKAKVKAWDAAQRADKLQGAEAA